MEKLNTGNSKNKKLITKMISQIIKTKPLDFKMNIGSRKALIEGETNDLTHRFLKLFQNQKKYSFN
ncbi:hypothetical protein NEF87_003716 [Candidatus Lokiarchaeum ossiferum]|uniref:Uncharacterized protein n=1 Tax=Candidatus Lokiarchaeum ossiferum TaxID=2951803 RepID=A0ABY6HXY0_9ARCH|nr:hypothetical protein NEF87_003716 [Candidatus Lokiarchaeum sp. B-35]